MTEKFHASHPIATFELPEPQEKNLTIPEPTMLRFAAKILWHKIASLPPSSGRWSTAGSGVLQNIELPSMTGYSCREKIETKFYGPRDIPTFVSPWPPQKLTTHFANSILVSPK